MKKRLLLAATALALSAAPVLAQMGGPPGEGGPMHGFGGGLMAGGMGGLHGKLVINAPYSAALSNQVTHHLADGNTIQRTSTGQVARDSQGRTYERITITGGPFGETGTRVLIFLTDPVGGYAYSIDETKKVAMQRPLPPHNGPHSHSGPEAEGGPLGAHGGAMTESELPADSSSGVNAQGKRATRTIPAKAMGNAQPIVSTTDTWYSPDLQIVVKSVRNDPFFGQSTFELSNIASKEPDPALFKVPAGYTIKNANIGHDHSERPDRPPPPPMN